MHHTARRLSGADRTSQPATSVVPPEKPFSDLVHMALDAGFSPGEVTWMLDLRDGYMDAPFRPIAMAA